MLRILLVEDDLEQRALYQEVLEEAGYKVLVAATAAQALEVYQQKKPDLVVLDIQMPGMDGIDAMARMMAKDKHVPIVFHSAYPAYKANFLTWAADAFVAKCGDVNVLVNAVKTIFVQRGLEVGEPIKQVVPQEANGSCDAVFFK